MFKFLQCLERKEFFVLLFHSIIIWLSFDFQLNRQISVLSVFQFRDKFAVFLCFSLLIRYARICPVCGRFFLIEAGCWQTVYVAGITTVSFKINILHILWSLLWSRLPIRPIFVSGSSAVWRISFRLLSCSWQIHFDWGSFRLPGRDVGSEDSVTSWHRKLVPSDLTSGMSGGPCLPSCLFWNPMRVMILISVFLPFTWLMKQNIWFWSPEWSDDDEE